MKIEENVRKLAFQNVGVKALILTETLKLYVFWHVRFLTASNKCDILIRNGYFSFLSGSLTQLEREICNLQFDIFPLIFDAISL